MDRSDVEGRTITKALRRVHESEKEGENFFRVFLELAGKDLLEVGVNRQHDPLKMHPSRNQVASPLMDVQDKAARDCVGAEIAAVLVASEFIYFRLADGRYLWIDEEEYGTAVRLEDEGYMARGPMVFGDYWGA